jgi:GH15 family glucan-1,4-alpha-glucosidase
VPSPRHCRAARRLHNVWRQAAAVDPAAFIEPEPDPSIEDYAVIGNCRTLALVSRFGSIDWLCLPDFSSASYFAALLDRDHGGRFALTPKRVQRIEQGYVDGSNVLRTTFHCAEGVLELTDFMAMKESPSGRDAETLACFEIVRIARCLAGAVELQALYRPRPDYARSGAARLTLEGDAWRCQWAAAATRLHTRIALVMTAPDTLAASVVLRAGEQVDAVLVAPDAASDRADPAPPSAHPSQQLAATLAWWHAWCARSTYRGPYAAAVMRSALALKLLTYSPSGAVVAAGTTSLPEGADGSRNWDYRFCWLRDTSLVLQSFMDLGYIAESEAFLGWLLRATRATRPRLQVMYDIHGATELGEHTLPQLRGYHGIGPVRVGNAASKQLQNDIYGEVVVTACEFVRRGGRLDADEQRLLAGLADVVCRLWREPDHGLWEIRLPPRHNTHSKLMCWAALDRVLWLHEAIGLPLDAPRLHAEREALRADIEAHGFDAALGAYVGYYGGRAVDASLLLIPRLGYVAAGDPRMRGTLQQVMGRLGVGGLLYRYPPGQGYDGIGGRENLFAICSFWCVDCLARQGRLDEAHAMFERLLALRNHAGLYAEEFEATTLRPLGNYPQAFSHVGMITAALSLEQAAGTPTARGT